MSMGWKDSQNFQFGRRHIFVQQQHSSHPPLLERSLAKVQQCYPCAIRKTPPPFAVTPRQWAENINREEGDDNGDDGTDPRSGGLEGLRLVHKRQQLDNVLAALDFLYQKYSSASAHNRPIHLVEFCASSGYCGFPFAAAHWQEHEHDGPKVTIVDANLSSIQIGWQRLKKLQKPLRKKHLQDAAFNVNTNMKLLVGRTEDFSKNFDIGVGLHACGEATDAVLDQCLKKRAAFCVVPCCVGRLHRLALGYGNGETAWNLHPGACVEFDDGTDLHHAKAVERQWKQDLTNMRNSRYDGRPRPRSQALAQALAARIECNVNDIDNTSNSQILQSARAFAALAKAADATQWTHKENDEDAHEETCQKTTTADSLRRKAAKRIVDWDRLQLAQEQGYVTHSFTMIPSTCTPKNEVLVGYPKEWDDS